MNTQTLPESSKSPIVTLLLCLFLGALGIHRFYVGKIGTGIIMLLTGGGFGIWVLVDLILITTNKFEDKQGKRIILLKNPSSVKQAGVVIGIVIAWLLLISISITSLAFYATSGLVTTVNNQLIALKEGDIEKAYSYTSKDFQSSTSLNDFKHFLERYPSLTHNKTYFFTERSIENNQGKLQGTLTSTDGAKTPVKYNLIKEDGAWKIIGIELISTGMHTEGNNNNNKENTNSSSSNLSQTFENEDYSIKYPENWEYEKARKSTVVFGGKKDSQFYYNTVNIQILANKAIGGEYESQADVVNALKEQFKAGATDVKILDEGDAQLPSNNKVAGKYLLVTYKRNNETYKQLEFVFTRQKNDGFLAWAYTAPADKYDNGLAIAKSMFESWQLK